MKTSLHRALATSQQHLEDARREPALAALLEAWRMSRSSEIADVVDRLSEMVTALEPPIRAVGSTSARKAWLDAAAEARPAAFGRLLETLPDGNDRCARLRTLLSMPPDPRVATWARRWLEAPPIRGAANRNAFFCALLDVLGYTRDPRISILLSELAHDRPSVIARLGLRTWKPLVARANDLAIIEIVPLDDDAHATLDRIRSLVAAPVAGAIADPKTLFDRVYAAPDDDETRAVLGDLLQQRGDPRGEFIALQLARHGTTKKRTARERVLEKTWGRTWLGAIDAVVLRGDVVFERGFVTECRFKGDGAGKDTSGAPEWATVTHLDVAEASKYVGGSERLLASGRLGALRSLTGATARDLAAATLPRLEVLGLRLWHWDANIALLRQAGIRFPAARAMHVRHAREFEEIAVTAPELVALVAAWPSVTELEVNVGVQQVAQLFLEARSVERFTVIARHHRITYDRASKTLAVRTAADPATHAPIAALLTTLGASRPSIVEHLQIDHGYTQAVEESLVDLRAIARGCGVAITIVTSPKPEPAPVVEVRPVAAGIARDR